MNMCRRFLRGRSGASFPTALVFGGLLLLMVTAMALPTPAAAQSECNTLINLSYQGANPFALPGDNVTVVGKIGTGTIVGGTNNTVSINRIRFDLDCNAGFALGIPCTD